MRLAFVCFSGSRGGLELMLVRIAATLQERGHSILFVCPPETPLHHEVEKAHIPHLLLSPRLKYLDLASALTMARRFEDGGTQIAIVGTSKDISTSVLAKLLYRNLRLVYFQQMQSGIDKRDAFHRWAHRRLDGWITLTRAMEQMTAQTTVVPPERIHVLPFGADLARFHPRPSARAKARRTFHLPSNRKIVAVLGRFDPQKGQEYFLRAAPTVLRSVPASFFLLVGEETLREGGYLRHLKSLVDNLELRKHVQFLPFTEDVPTLLSAIDVVVLPSLSETFGYLAVEAMAMGIPVIGTNAGGLPEIIEDGATGFLVPPGDSAELADRIISLLKTKRTYREMSHLGKAKVSQSFDFAKNIATFEKLMTSISA